MQLIHKTTNPALDVEQSLDIALGGRALDCIERQLRA